MVDYDGPVWSRKNYKELFFSGKYKNFWLVWVGVVPFGQL